MITILFLLTLAFSALFVACICFGKVTEDRPLYPNLDEFETFWHK